jgi:hypothetical protein
LRAAFDKGLIEVSAAVAEYLSAVISRTVSVDQVTGDILEALDFIDDRLWCDETAAALDINRLDLDTLSADQSVSVRLDVRGIENPLYAPGSHSSWLCCAATGRPTPSRSTRKITTGGLSSPLANPRGTSANAVLRRSIRCHSKLGPSKPLPPTEVSSLTFSDPTRR